MKLMSILFLASAVFAGVLFQDDFSDGNADGWHEISWVNYDVVEGMYRMYGGYQENHGISFNGDQSGYMSTPDYSAMCMVRPETGVFFGLMCRFDENSDYNIMLVMSDIHQSLRFYRWGISGLTLLASTPFQVEMFQDYWIRCEVCGDEFMGRSWTGGPSQEPQQWMVQTSDTLSSPGSVALFCAGIPYDVSLSCRFDDVVVTDPASSMLQSTWACMKSLWLQPREGR